MLIPMYLLILIHLRFHKLISILPNLIHQKKIPIYDSTVSLPHHLKSWLCPNLVGTILVRLYFKNYFLGQINFPLMVWYF